MEEQCDLYLSLGTNLGDRLKNISVALEMLGKALGTGYSALSSVVETEPWGFEADTRFLNAVARYRVTVPRRTSRSGFAHGILKICKDIERSMGRTGGPEYDAGGKRIYRSRIIDIDILMIGDWRIDEDDLKIPHPMMAERDFVMVPLKEIYGMDGFSADR